MRYSLKVGLREELLFEFVLRNALELWWHAKNVGDNGTHCFVRVCDGSAND